MKGLIFFFCDFFIVFVQLSRILVYQQGSTMIIKLPYVITNVYQNFGIGDEHISYQVPYPLPIDFRNNFS